MPAGSLAAPARGFATHTAVSPTLRSAATRPTATHAFPAVHEVLQSPGRPLDEATREFFEPRFRHDFARVRVHSGSGADRSAAALGAQAYVVGDQMVFGARHFSPTTPDGRRLLAHELAHNVQQGNRSTTLSGQLSVTSPSDPAEQAAERISREVLRDGALLPGSTALRTGLTVARSPDPVAEATAEDRVSVVLEAARFLRGMADFVHTKREAAAVALATTPGSAAGPRAFHRHLNQAQIEPLLAKTISVFDAQKSGNPLVNFPDESPEQTQLGEAYARAMEQLGLAIEEARVNGENLAPDVEAAENERYARNHLSWLAGNPAAPLAAGIRRTFTQTEVDISTRQHQRVSSELADLVNTVHRYNLAGDGPDRLRTALHNAAYRLERDASTREVRASPDAAAQALIQPILDQLDGIEWAIDQAVDRLDRAETLTRTFADDPAANAAVGDKLQAHFATRDAGYATLLAHRFARMSRELRGQGALAVHARNPQDPDCGVGSVMSGFSVTAAHAEPNHFYFCGEVTIGNDATVSTVIHEAVHAVIPALGSAALLTRTSETPRDRSYAGERIYSRLTTEEALDNAETYAFYVDELLGVGPTRTTPPGDTVTGCSDTDAVHDALARATYRIRLGAMWASQTSDNIRGQAMPQFVIDVVQRGFPGADAARSRDVLAHLRNLAGRLEYYLPVVCRPSSDAESRAGALVYGPSARATGSGVSATGRTYPAGTLRICPDWFQATSEIREDSLTAILALRYRSSLPAADARGIATLVRFIQAEAHPSVAGRTLQQHEAADQPPAGP